MCSQKLLQAVRDSYQKWAWLQAPMMHFAHLIIWHCKCNEFGEMYFNISTRTQHILLSSHANRVDPYTAHPAVFRKLLRLDAIRGKIVQFLAKHVFDKNMCRSQMPFNALHMLLCYHKHLPFERMEHSGSMCM